MLWLGRSLAAVGPLRPAWSPRRFRFFEFPPKKPNVAGLAGMRRVWYPGRPTSRVSALWWHPWHFLVKKNGLSRILRNEKVRA